MVKIHAETMAKLLGITPKGVLTALNRDRIRLKAGNPAEILVWFAEKWAKKQGWKPPM